MNYIGKEEEEKHRCLECGDEISYGRSDKKFCSIGCKNHYHNRLNHAADMIRERVVVSLKLNYEILQRILSSGRPYVKLTDLKKAGFSPEFYTSVLKNGKHLEVSCFDITYCMSKMKIFNVRKRGIRHFPGYD